MVRSPGFVEAFRRHRAGITTQVECFLPDESARVASGDRDGFVYVWDPNAADPTVSVAGVLQISGQVAGLLWTGPRVAVGDATGNLTSVLPGP